LFIVDKMKAKVVNFRRSLKRIKERHYILDIGKKNRNDASGLVGKEVIWTSQAGKKIKGKIAAAHGNKGLVRAIFEKGLPGQAMNTDIEVME
jgi:large subunit ribosomal protein L35Ae